MQKPQGMKDPSGGGMGKPPNGSGGGGMGIPPDGGMGGGPGNGKKSPHDSKNMMSPFKLRIKATLDSPETKG